MERDLGNDPDLAEALERKIASRQVVKGLLNLRCALQLSQKDLADKMGCSQSRISKLENGTDDELRLADLRGYAKAFGHSITILLGPKKQTLVNQVKYHSACIKSACDQLAALALDDEGIAAGVAEFFDYAAVKFLSDLARAAEKLPRQQPAETEEDDDIQLNIQTTSDNAERRQPTTEECLC